MLGRIPTILPWVRAFSAEPSVWLPSWLWSGRVPCWEGTALAGVPSVAACPSRCGGLPASRLGARLNPRSPQASQLGVYKAFVDNYKIALETAEKCSQSNYQFQKISEVSWAGGCAGGDRAAAAGLSRHRAENADRICPAEMLSLPLGTVPGAGPSVAVLEGRGSLEYCRGLAPASCKLTWGSALAVVNSGMPGQPVPACPIQGAWVLGAGHLWLISCWLHLHAWLPYRNGDLRGCSLAPRSPQPLHSRAVQLGGTSNLPGLLWVLLRGCPMGPPCPHCWAQPEPLPTKQRPVQSPRPPQHPRVTFSVARLGPGGDIRVQEGWGGTP